MFTKENFYRSNEWQNLLAVLKVERLNSSGLIICEHCGKPIVKKYDCIGHHKIELTATNINNYDISLNPDNIAFVHHACHNKIHNKLGKTVQSVWLVYGSPLSGKTSYVKSVMQEGDVIVDIDNIWQALSGCDRYIKPNRIKPLVFSVRDTLIDNVKHRLGNWENAYIIGGYPLVGERERLCKALGARDIFIDTPQEICQERLKYCGDNRKKCEWKKYIDEWYRLAHPPTLR